MWYQWQDRGQSQLPPRSLKNSAIFTQLALTPVDGSTGLLLKSVAAGTDVLAGSNGDGMCGGSEPISLEQILNYVAVRGRVALTPMSLLDVSSCGLTASDALTPALVPNCL